MKGLNVVGYIAAVLLLLPGAAIAAETVKLSLDQSLKLARESNYALKAAKARVDQAEARYVQSRKALLPKVTLSETFIATDDPASVFTYKLRQGSIAAADFNPAVLNNPDDISNFNLGVEVMQPIFNRDAAFGRSAASLSKISQEHMLRRSEETIALEVKKVYYGLVLARKNLDAVKSSIRAMQLHDSEAAKAYSKGLITKSDKLSTAVRIAELTEQKMMTEDEIRSAKDGLRFLLRLDSDMDIVPLDGLETDNIVIPADEPLMSESRADLKALEAYADAAGYQYDMAKAKRLPRLNAFFQKNWNDDDFPGFEQNSWTLGVAMEWTVFDGYSNIGKAKEARAGEMEARYSYEEAKDKGLYEIRKAYRLLRTAKSRIRVAEQSLKEAKVSLDFIGERYRSGLAMTFELLGREQAYTYARMRLNQAKYDLIIAKSELDYYTGG
ncbi:TolC family protein [Prosthecochloris sp. SCSIO W1101]|uniref:TolC family protein n=1 Tax=Prosthecochloris sp. SCSIO W1101 TaxID=2992242 RepID=UPI00223CEEF3|nr:TolC family protein [Prosthecochloris sp. SCSIO W1101]UZJ41245.1 TolC family protein [Prosthecochloris sp. SCSIO W1101]